MLLLSSSWRFSWSSSKYRRGLDENGMKLKNQRISEKSSVVTAVLRGENSSSSYVSVGGILAQFYTGPYEAPGIAEALERARLDEGRARCVSEECAPGM